MAAPVELPAPPDLKAPPGDARKSAGGLITRVLHKGSGRARPAADAILDVHYTGWTTEGKMFDSSMGRGGPARVVLSGMPKGWQLGIPQMLVGEKRRFWIPAGLAFDDRTLRADRPGGPLVYDIELVAIVPRAPSTEAPPDVKAPPPSALRTPSGLAHRLLQKGWGHEHPRDSEMVRLHYNAWTTSGKLFESTRARGEAVKVTVGQSMPGWAEGLKLMVPGERRRFWIPAALAHGDPPRRRGFPPGMTVFEVELLSIVEADEEEEED
jgi:peptidylprolyl isomerase